MRGAIERIDPRNNFTTTVELDVRDYFCGFDQTGARGAGATGPAAWIYKGTLPQLTKDAP